MDQAVKKQSNDVTAQPVSSVGTVNKESGIRASVEASEKLPTVSQELQKYIKTEEPQVPHEPQAGINASGASTPVSTQPSSNIKLPYTEEEAEEVLKESKHSISASEHIGDESGKYSTESKFFLAEEVRKLFKKLKDSTTALIKKPV